MPPSGGIFWYQTHVLVADQEYNAAEQPGNGVCPGNSFQLIPVGERNGNITDSDDTPGDQHGRHGYSGFCEAPENSGHAVGEGHQEVKQTDTSHMADTVVYHTGRIIEKTDELRLQLLTELENLNLQTMVDIQVFLLLSSIGLLPLSLLVEQNFFQK